MPRLITISGDLGAGKSTVARAMAAALGYGYVSTGDFQRAMAEAARVSVLEFNHRADTDRSVDQSIDGWLAGLAGSPDPLVVDARLGWHFLPVALSMHLLVDPVVAAERVLARPTAATEAYADAGEARAALAARAASERGRFLRTYGIDIARLRNYDVVVDTTQAGPDEVVRCLVESAAGEPARRPALLLAPRRLLPTRDVERLRGAEAEAVRASVAAQGFLPAHPVEVARGGDGALCVVDGHRRLSAALGCGLSLIPASLRAEGSEPVAAGLTAGEFLEREATRQRAHDWEKVHGFVFTATPWAA